MKTVIKALCIVLVLVLAVSFAGCARSIVNKLTDGAIDIGKDGNIKIKGEDGKDIEFGTAKWDKSKMHGLSEPKAELTSYMSSAEGTMYSFSGMKEKDAKNYLNEIKKAGFEYNTVTLDEYSYTGTNKNGLIINFMYDKETGEGSIISGKGEAPTGDKSDVEVGSSNKKWDSKEVGGLPDPGITITYYTVTDSEVTYSFDSFKKPADYIKKIKSAGFTEDQDAYDEEGTYYYSAYNKDGDQIQFYASDNGGTLIYSKAEK